MAKTCSWCGTKIGFIDMMYDEVDTGAKWHYVCGDCYRKIDSVKNGHATIEEIVTDETDPDLLHYYQKCEQQTQQKMQQEIQQQQIKEESQQTNPLYDDIHQIAGDLRFIKNYLIFTIIAGIVLGLIVACSAL